MALSVKDRNALCSIWYKLSPNWERAAETCHLGDHDSAYGATSRLFLSAATIWHYLRRMKGQCPLTARIFTSTWVTQLQAQKVQRKKSIYEEELETMIMAGMHLQKWTSDAKVQKFMSKEEGMQAPMSNMPSQKVVGLAWRSENEFHFDMELLISTSRTPEQITSDSSYKLPWVSLDPFAFLTLMMMTAIKVLFQSIWHIRINWAGWSLENLDEKCDK